MKSNLEVVDESRQDPRIMELDADLLARPFEVETKWHVITGAICCGKTTLIDMLAERGFRTLGEASREYIEREVARGRKLEELFGSVADERILTEMQREAEDGLPANEVMFLDRALPDYLWFWRLFGMNPNELLARCFRYRYASVFVLDQLPLQLDGARIDDEAYTDLLDEWLVRDYGALGYHVVRVPVMSPDERLAFVLKKLAGQGLL